MNNSRTSAAQRAPPLAGAAGQHNNTGRREQSAQGRVLKSQINTRNMSRSPSGSIKQKHHQQYDGSIDSLAACITGSPRLLVHVLITPLRSTAMHTARVSYISSNLTLTESIGLFLHTQSSDAEILCHLQRACDCLALPPLAACTSSQLGKVPKNEAFPLTSAASPRPELQGGGKKKEAALWVVGSTPAPYHLRGRLSLSPYPTMW